MTSPHYYEKMVPSMCPQARDAYETLVAAGVDGDLAVLVIEKLLGPEKTYEG